MPTGSSSAFPHLGHGANGGTMADTSPGIGPSEVFGHWPGQHQDHK
ncbi:hypothetical protein FH37_gp57 [Mycobacterium phage Bernal13]|uniref:Uncharacterized protein n=4 Tax=Bernalvirus bernal13 TaxID=1982102 RepID=A0A023W7E8_9CAUD|nr:hypothetical protein FH37_gp57 [Mycobacterium phage Bernal13]AIT13471.1 hypothetical protein PBI_RONRAYGUN_58 [Mycobacterium phage RonRayGun]ASJ79144.1 hypothetical protein SEA_ZENTIME222_64 [Mycobacterium phage ZenTime222]QBP28903.1 hypothetical protein SEA_IBRAHIM_58 [Mycobacterium phage Ibrahim]QHB47462.1 hypothetical protein SEA_WHITTY_57 [Mycobacterium phage Whitty]AHY26973.1 hypothetical protein PBI_BERNAL13_58 [Mycobacterium phage Bernal13]